MRSPRLEVICVGTELLTGKINTHIGYLGRTLPNIGLSIAREHTVGDDEKIMRECFSDAFRRSDIVLCFGGLGPTFDDITRDVWSKVLGRSLVEQSALVKNIEKKFRHRGFPMPPANRRQAQVMKGATVINNPNGTAPGQWIRIGKKLVALLPGPTREMVPMFESTLAALLSKFYGHRVLQAKTFLLVGVPESKVDEIVRPFVARYASLNGCSVTHGILASQSIVSVKFIVEGARKSAVQKTVRHLNAEVRRLLHEHIFGEDDDTLGGVVGELLRKKKQTLALAESCTGGSIAKTITDTNGASDYFMEGVVTYHNTSKVRRLGVRPRTLAKHGAVSEQTAREMAVGVRRKAKTTYGLSVTGIAGPTGGTKKKPVGLVYVGIASPRRTLVKEFRFAGDRTWIRHRAALIALDLLRRELLA